MPNYFKELLNDKSDEQDELGQQEGGIRVRLAGGDRCLPISYRMPFRGLRISPTISKMAGVFGRGRGKIDFLFIKKLFFP